MYLLSTEVNVKDFQSTCTQNLTRTACNKVVLFVQIEDIGTFFKKKKKVLCNYRIEITVLEWIISSQMTTIIKLAEE